MGFGGIGPNPQSPIPNPQSPILLFINLFINFNNINKNKKIIKNLNKK